ncbi:mitochondrial 18 KDa protein-domain-containing protein [Leucosporidium creatinivorum]|uniref:Mitochondrial fission process protein 1 n=1 Tax=Leucosporidium creatinivorum TaxID=106004 RepID=A0A1Y2F2I9_9BASI|nr:mitochondrial 18 KDa protein-domain-containing protein [Leucosporidium creatinivorum]
MSIPTAKDVEKQLVLAEKEVAAGEIDTTETPARYLAFLARIRPVLQPATRYLAYTSDVGEAARPVVAPKIVTAAYGVSWLYLIGDTGYEGYKAKLRSDKYCPESQMEVVGLGVAKRAIFQATASMLFPSLTIHSIVKYSSQAIKRYNFRNLFVQRWGASLLGLSFIPALPYIFDEPVEHVVDKAFDALEAKLYPDPNSPIRRALRGENPHSGPTHNPLEKAI